MSKRYPTIKAQGKALDEMKRILSRDMKVMTDDFSIEEATPELLERVVLFEGILNMFDILEEKVTAGILLASKVVHNNDESSTKNRDLISEDIYRLAKICLVLMCGEE